MNTLFKQKLSGLAFILLGLLSIPACDMDATAALLFIPFGIFLAVSSEVYVDTCIDDEWSELED